MRDQKGKNLGNWQTQLRKGFLDLCILNFLKGKEFYGYDLVQELKKINGLAMREGTIYPILARLQEDEFVTSQVRSSDNGPPRKYFQITTAGRTAVEEMNNHWGCLADAMRNATAFGVRSRK